MLIFNMQFGMVAVALGPMTDGLHAPLRWSGWVLTIFLLGMVIAQPIAGGLAERIGARTVFVGGLAVFTLASVVCALAPNVYVLILGRLLQGLAGGGLMPAGISLIGEVYASGRTRAIGLYASMMPFGAVFGPVAGGLIVDWFGWRATFMLNAPVGVVACVLAFLVLPPGAKKPARRSDLPGSALIAITMTAFIFALTELGRRDAPPSTALVAGALFVFAVGLVLFVRQEQRTPVPIVDLALVTRPPFAATYVLSMAFGMGWQGIVSIIPLYAQEGYGLSVAQSGALSGPRGFTMIGFSALSSMLLYRTGFRKPIAIGLIGLGLVIALISLGIREPRIAGVTMSDFWWLLLVVSSAGIFYGAAVPSLNNAGLNLAPERIATLVGLRGMFHSLGGTIGIALAVLITSRGSSTVVGLQAAFLTIGVLAVLSSICVLWVPEIPRTPEGASTLR
ncbi:MAG: MFS transporter, partial [Chloroflexota bacterium]